MYRPPVDLSPNLSPHRREALNVPPSHPSRSPLQGEMAEDEAFFSAKGLGVRFDDCGSYN